MDTFVIVRTLLHSMRFPGSVTAKTGISVTGTPPLPHPRLLASAGDFDRIREGSARPGPLRDAFLLLRETAEREYAEPPVERIFVGLRLPSAGEALRRILNFALLYRLTGETRWAARAEREMLAVAAFADWNPSFFLNTATIAAGVAIGYDWLYDTLSPESRRTIREALVRHALRPGDSDQLHWRALHNNWVQVCETGLALSALAIAEDESELASVTIARARRNVSGILDTYAPSGSYAEGPSYWAYGTTFHVLLAEALRTATGFFGDLVDASFLQSADVVNLLTGPGGDFFNYGDAREKRTFLPVMYWFARETARPGVAATEHVRLRVFPNDGPTGPGRIIFPDPFFALALLWMSVDPASDPVQPPAAWATEGVNPLAIFRRGEGRESLFAGIKGGRARSHHGHMDAGGFILELGGVRWTADLGAPVYHDLEQAGVRLFEEDRWSVYALGPHSHSIPLIDDIPPDENAAATLHRFSAETQSAVIDLTPLYAGRAGRLHRELRIESSDTIVIGDTLAGAAPGARYRFSWMTRAAVETDVTGVTLRHGGRTLRIDFIADAPLEIVDEDASRPPAAYDAAQPGLRRVGAVFGVSKPEHSFVTRARLIPAS